MSTYCPYCGRDSLNASNIVNAETVNSNVNLYNKERDDNGWSCFASLCYRKQTATPRTNDVALNSEFNDASAKYKRRATIHFQLDPVVESDDVPHRRHTYKQQASILKSKVNQMRTSR